LEHQLPLQMLLAAPLEVRLKHFPQIMQKTSKQWLLF
jgi:hypothetical protein